MEKYDYLTEELKKYKTDINESNEKIISVKETFAKQITNGLGNEIKNGLKPKKITFKDKVKYFFNKLINVYG